MRVPSGVVRWFKKDEAEENSKCLSILPRVQRVLRCPAQFALDQEAAKAKLGAVQAHRSQTKVMGRVMESYVRTIELFSRTPAPPRSACTHPQPCEFEDGSLMEESGL